MTVIKGSMWLVFGFLCLYVYLSHQDDEFDNHTSTIRKIWYLIFIAGCLVFLTSDLHSLMDNWKQYLIVLIAFIIIDSLLFLELHVSKLGGQELNSTKMQIDLTQQQLDNITEKSRNVPDILTTFSFPIYNLDSAEYIDKLQQLINEYGHRENLSIKLYRYSGKEKDYMLNNLGRLRNKAKRLLDQNISLFSSLRIHLHCTHLLY